MNQDLQTIFYTITTIFMVAMLAIGLYVFIVLRTIISKINNTTRSIRLGGALTKMAVLRGALKLLK